MAVMIFEDYTKTPSSVLLRNTTACRIEFSGGSSNLMTTIEENLHEDLVVVYYDLVPNNDRTVKGLQILKEKTADFPNVRIVPIICIEYYILYSLLYTKLSNYGLKDKLDIKKSHDNILREESVEKYYKRVLNDLGSSASHCFINSFRYVNGERDIQSKHGRFYCVDCLCTERCKITDSPILVQEKCDRIVCRLPYVPGVINKKLGDLFLRGVTFNEVLNERRDYYSYLCESLSLSKDCLFLI